MPSKRFYIFAILFISFTLITSGIFVGDRISNINAKTQKASVVEVVQREEGQIINFEPSQPISINTQTPNTITENILKDENKTEEAKITPKKTPTYTCPIPKKEYEDMWLLNVGQNTNLPDDSYIPKNLVEVKHSLSVQNNICLTEETNTNLETMLAKAKIDGLDIQVSSAFRNFNTQQYLMDNAINNGNPNASIAIAKAGYSEHQLGTTVDLTGSSINFASAAKAFDKTPEADWLETNASDYGFVRSYPLGKESITGYMYEPWHYRYVGVDNAKIIKEKELTISEFLAK